jgi:putative methionine-R-sulfoxide reductase with GAF domain
MQTRLAAVVRRFGADTASLHLLDEAGVLVLAAQVGLPPHIVEIVSRVPMGKGMAGLAALRNEPVSSCNIQTDESGDVPRGARTTGVNGAIVVPVRDPEGRVRGALGIGVYRSYEYTAAETEHLLAEAARFAAG